MEEMKKVAIVHIPVHKCAESDDVVDEFICNRESDLQRLYIFCKSGLRLRKGASQ